MERIAPVNQLQKLSKRFYSKVNEQYLKIREQTDQKLLEQQFLQHLYPLSIKGNKTFEAQLIYDLSTGLRVKKTITLSVSGSSLLGFKKQSNEKLFVITAIKACGHRDNLLVIQIDEGVDEPLLIRSFYFKCFRANVICQLLS